MTLRRIWKIGLPLLLLLFAANHVEHLLRTGGDADGGETRASIPVRTEAGEGEHVRIGVDEEALDLDLDVPLLTFKALGEWTYDPVKKTGPPETLKKLDGKRVALAGFMVVEEDAGDLGTFFLARAVHPRSHGHAAFEKAPAPNRVVRVQTAAPVEAEVRRPVLARGVFRLAPGGEAHYALEEATIEVGGAPGEGRGGTTAEGLPVFDFFWLESVGSQEARDREAELPEDLKALEGERVVVEGYLMGREQGPPRLFIIGKNFWNGCCVGEPPTYSDSVLVLPAEGEPLPPAWREEGAYAGVLALNEDPEAWTNTGIARIEKARAVREKEGKGKPYLPLWLEAALLAAALLVAFKKKPEG